MRVLEPCALLSQGLHDPILAARQGPGGKVGWIEGGRPSDSDRTAVGCQVLELGREEEACGSGYSFSVE